MIAEGMKVPIVFTAVVTTDMTTTTVTNVTTTTVTNVTTSTVTAMANVGGRGEDGERSETKSESGEFHVTFSVDLSRPKSRE